MFKEIKIRISELKNTSEDIDLFIAYTKTKREKMALLERSMQISFEIDFLNKLLSYEKSI